MRLARKPVGYTDFLVGISIDGPRRFHDQYRKTKGGKGSFGEVKRGLDHLREEGVEFNVLTVVQRHNGDHPVAVYEGLKQLGAQYLQFIPIPSRNDRWCRSNSGGSSSRCSKNGVWYFSLLRSHRAPSLQPPAQLPSIPHQPILLPNQRVSARYTSYTLIFARYAKWLAIRLRNASFSHHQRRHVCCTWHIGDKGIEVE